MAKFRNKKVKFDNITFDSQAEYRRYLWLKDEVEQGNITLLKVHPKFVLEPKKAHFNARTLETEVIGAITHAPDFSYVDTRGFEIVEDVKGVATDAWKLKYKLFRNRYPHIHYLVIPAKDC